MKRIFIAGVIFFLTTVGTGMAITFTGQLTASDGLTTLPQWNQAVFAWEVDDSTNPGYWTYSYNWIANAKEIKQLDIEVSDVFTISDLISWQASNAVEGPEGPDSFDEVDGSSLFGLGWELAEDTKTFSLKLVSTRLPMWGDIFANDGTSGRNAIYAKNSMFGDDTNDEIGDGNNGGWALVPDTTKVPIPGAAWLLGSALLSLVLIRKNKKNY